MIEGVKAYRKNRKASTYALCAAVLAVASALCIAISLIRH
jgi:hypothetical protein